jgi:hypothetical protein
MMANGEAAIRKELVIVSIAVLRNEKVSSVLSLEPPGSPQRPQFRLTALIPSLFPLGLFVAGIESGRDNRLDFFIGLG